MLSIKQLSKILESATISKVEKDTGISRHNLLRVKSGDATVPYSAIQKLSVYFGE